MMAFIDRIRSAQQRRAEYQRTRAELARLPVDVRLDLDIYDVDETARRAVYG